MTSPRPALATPTNVEAPFYPVATHKFVVMSICTLGLYQPYWAYKCWKRIQTRSPKKIAPLWRAFFSRFYAFELFESVRDYARQNRVAVTWNAQLLAGLYLVVPLMWRLRVMRDLMVFLTFLPAIPVVLTIQAIRRSGKFRERLNDEYNLVHVVVIILGGSLIVFNACFRVAHAIGLLPPR